MQFLFQIKECVPHLRLSHPTPLIRQRNEACAALVAGGGTASTAQALPPGRGTGTRWDGKPSDLGPLVPGEGTCWPCPWSGWGSADSGWDCPHRTSHVQNKYLTS